MKDLSKIVFLFSFSLLFLGNIYSQSGTTIGKVQKTGTKDASTTDSIKQYNARYIYLHPPAHPVTSGAKAKSTPKTNVSK